MVPDQNCRRAVKRHVRVRMNIPDYAALCSATFSRNTNKWKTNNSYCLLGEKAKAEILQWDTGSPSHRIQEENLMFTSTCRAKPCCLNLRAQIGWLASQLLYQCPVGRIIEQCPCPGITLQLLVQIGHVERVHEFPLCSKQRQVHRFTQVTMPL